MQIAPFGVPHHLQETDTPPAKMGNQAPDHLH
jgi:hypothetical protein